ncbi:MAG: hypothetical protein HUK22_04305 [Thermoguttaceae bacterium]|nr:hypothetical protein [Thermoguttaceae bacterium]
MKRFMNPAARIVGVFGLLIALSAVVFAQNPATTLEDRNIDRYKAQAERAAQGDVDLLWVGDSITHFWEGAGKEVWEKYYSNRKAMNFAISGDRTGHVLWRMANTEMDKISPKMAVVMIGTNNIGHFINGKQHSSPAETVEGIQAIVNGLKAQYPTMKILLLEVFARGNKADDPRRLDVDAINAGLREIYADGAVENVQLFSINNLFLTEDGTLPPEIMPDFLHPNKAGYEIWAKAIEPMIQDGLGENSVDTTPAAVNAEWWMNRFNEKNEELKKGDVDILMVGDSITHGWEGAGKDVWQKYYGNMKAVNLGIGGDQTQAVLWRLENYDWSNVNPKLAVMLIGVNNTWGRDREIKNIALGNRRIAQKLHALFPELKIIALKIFPCTNDNISKSVLGDRFDEATFVKQQDYIDSINALLPYYFADMPYVESVDIGYVFMNKDGVLTEATMPDLLHPNGVGYESWGAALYLKINEYLGK